jgi:RNA polymerase subunit RPABC4/transcription elongation factor Spt4
MPGALRYVFRIGLPLIVSFYLLMTGYVYGDARRRGMRAFMWALLAFLIPNAIGFILYFVMREPLMRTCRQCGKLVSGQFAFCPNCGASRAPSCPNCRAAVEADWPHCAHCGTALKRAG